jgi:hypothetical protein
MNPPNSVLAGETDALTGALTPCETSPRPIHHPETGTHSGFGGGR